MMRRTSLIILRAALGLASLTLTPLLPAVGHAQSYPSRTVTLVLPFPAGSATDSVARHVGEELRKRLDKPVIIENKPGADGIIAAQHVLRSEPDGHTVFVTTNTTHAINPSLYEKLPYDPVADFRAVGGLIKIPLMLCVRADSSAADVPTLLALARGRTPPLLYGSGNTSSRVAGELLKSTGSIAMTHVAYRGTPQAVTDLLGGHIDVFFADPVSALSLVNDGKLRALAVTDRKRSPVMPSVPTMIELGFKDFEVVSWVAVFLPARAEPAIAKQLNREIGAILQEAATQAFIAKIGATVFATTPEELSDFVRAEITNWARLTALAGIERKSQ